MKKNLLLILSIIIIFLILIFFNLDNLRSYLKSNLPGSYKLTIKKIIFGQNYLDEVSYFRKLGYNVRKFPDTQFFELGIKKYKINDITDSAESHYNLIKGISAPKTKLFLATDEENLIVTSSTGQLRFIKDLKFQNIIKIQSNLSEIKDIEVMDTLIFEDTMYVSLKAEKNKEKNCDYFNVYAANFGKDPKKLSFKNIYKNNFCAKNNYGGRLHNGNFKNEKGIYITTGATESEQSFAQDPQSMLGKVIFLNLKSLQSTIISLGHRNPQGLEIHDDKIVATEHGPYGGDEINLIIEGKNYGWPVVSHGDTYEFEKFDSEERKNLQNYNLKKNHKTNNFRDPIYSFVPSIGISQIIHLPNNFSKYWQNNYLVTSLNGGSIFRLTFDRDLKKLISKERIYLLRRMRDIIYLENFKTIVLSIEGKPGEVWLLKSPA